MKKNILINATSLEKSGGLTVLNQYMTDLVNKPAEKDVSIYIFVPDSYKAGDMPDHIHCLNNSNNTFYKNKNFWNLVGLRKWAKHKGINADELFSLQNYFPFGFNDRNIFKRLYLHQPVPFFEYKWSIFDEAERELWFYKRIFYQLIKRSVKQSDQVIVQTQWFKKQLVKKIGIAESKVIVIKPILKDINFSKVDSIEGLEGKKKLFYPADDYVYKNHEVLYKAIDLLVNGPRQRKDLVLYVTLEKENQLAQKYIKECHLEKNIILIGRVRYDEVMRYYKSVDALVFPSKIETFGLPLLEAKTCGLPIIAAEVELYKEVIGDYGPNITYCVYHDENEWASAIESLYK